MDGWIDGRMHTCLHVFSKARYKTLSLKLKYPKSEGNEISLKHKLINMTCSLGFKEIQDSLIKKKYCYFLLTIHLVFLL